MSARATGEVRLRVLTWNLMHGRSQPPAGRELLRDFCSALASWEWDIALLQEGPPWWPAELASALNGRVVEHSVLTSRNSLLALRRAVARRWPDLIKSNGGGANAILIRGGGLAVVEHRVLRLALTPERRRLQAVRLEAGGRKVWVGNLHATVHNDGAARSEAERARVSMVRWTQGEPFLLGGDFNVRRLALAGLARVAAHDVDYVFASGLDPVVAQTVLDRGALSDHAPVAVTLRLGTPGDPLVSQQR